MTYAEWKDIIPVIGGQITILAVQVINAWHSSKRIRSLQNQVDQINSTSSEGSECKD